MRANARVTLYPILYCIRDFIYIEKKKKTIIIMGKKKEFELK